MSTMTNTHRKAALLGLALLALPACAAYKLEPPLGFAVVSENDWQTRMKAQDNVGLTLQRFENVKGGTLAFWAADLVKKLGNRNYTLVSQSEVETKNGQTGTRFDFDYETYDTAIPKFYTAVLVVTDEEKIVLQVAGDAAHATTYRAPHPGDPRPAQGPRLQGPLEDLPRRAAAQALDPAGQEARRARCRRRQARHRRQALSARVGFTHA
jgi:hypothetical protein